MTAATTRMTAANDHFTSWRLPAHHVQDLRDVARGVEETNIGVCTRYLLDELERKGPPGEDDVSLYEAERFVDRYDASTFEKLLGEHVSPWLRRIKRCRHTLSALRERGDYSTPAILHIAYGYPDPIVWTWTLTCRDFLGPELASLVRYSDATEAVRRELVKAGVERQVALGDSGWTAYAVRNCKAAKKEPPPKDVIELDRWRAAEKYLDRQISSGDALRSVFDSYPEPQPKRIPGEEDATAHERRRAAWEDRRDAHNARRTSFLVQVKGEVDRMLTRASRVYWEAWRGVAR